MRRGNLDSFIGATRQRSTQILVLLGFLYMILVTFEVPFLFKRVSESVQVHVDDDDALTFHNDPLSWRPQSRGLDSEEEMEEKAAPSRPLKQSLVAPFQLQRLSPSLEDSYGPGTQQRVIREYRSVSGLTFDWRALNSSKKDGFSALHKSAMAAFQAGEQLWEDLRSGKVQIDVDKAAENRTEICPTSVSYSSDQFMSKGRTVLLPCGLTLGSHITVVGKPTGAQGGADGDQSAAVSQFIIELIGLKTVDGEDPPRVLHFNPRLKGDWSGKPAIELNTCYRQQWGMSHRCEGRKSMDGEETVDGFAKCEKWTHDENNGFGESKETWWLNRLTGRTKKVALDWPYPFVEDKMFVLTMNAGLEGYHINVDGRHISSFPYRTGFSLEDATGLMINGGIDVHSVFAGSLPTTHPSFDPQKQLEMSSIWQAPPLPDGPVDLFIGILSAGNHFAERMAVRKSWMEDKLIKTSKVVARFFVALHARKEVNVDLKKEADFFGDIVIVPYMDAYDLVVVKTVAICEYGVRTVAAKYVMKCDDDNFVRVDAIVREAQRVPLGASMYVGNINYYHKPLRSGKWSVTYEEWPEEHYPPYANGPGYILSTDIANYIVTEFEKHNLRLFKMEDVSMGMWVEKFNASKRVEYIHSLKFCQFGCIPHYYTAHYQSPKQMICLWNKLQELGWPACCNMR